MKISHAFVTDDYLKIRKSEYKDFLIKMPIHATDCFKAVLKDGEYVFSERFNSFSYNGKEYDLYLHTGKNPVGSQVENYLNIPLPMPIDNMIKKIFLKTLNINSDNPSYEINSFAMIGTNELDELTEAIQSNVENFSDYNFSVNDIYKSLIRINETEYYVKRKGLKRWLPVPIPLCINFGIIPVKVYKELGEGVQSKLH